MRVVVVGGGIVGLAITYHLVDLGHQVVVIEKESHWAEHQTGRNSGVIHAGPYYKPGSLKAKMCMAGNRSMIEFARSHGIPHEVCGKLIVATELKEMGGLKALAERAKANGVDSQLLTKEESLDKEPHISAVGSLWVRQTGIISYSAVSKMLAEISIAAGAQMILGSEVNEIFTSANEVVVRHSSGEVKGDFLVNAAGLHSDRVARLAGFIPQVRIIPFRGEYFQLNENARHLVKNLIYPVPDPKLPFLGVHFTRMIDGSVHAGPNAVLATAREGYRKTDINIRDLYEAVSYLGFQKLAISNISVGLKEMLRSASKFNFTQSLKRLIPEISAKDLIPAEAGIRAQAVNSAGQLVDDFVIERGERQIHILNAPSPAATGALEIAKFVVSELEQAYGV